MTPIRFSPSSLQEGRWYEYLIRFALGGAATVFTGLISSRYGASIGGLFLALPAIFCASATLIEKHEIRRKREAGLDGESRGREAAALDAAGAALGALGMLAFAIVFSLMVESSILGRLYRRIACLADGLGGGLVRAPQDAISAKGPARQKKTAAFRRFLRGPRSSLRVDALAQRLPFKLGCSLAFSSFRLVVRKRAFLTDLARRLAITFCFFAAALTAHFVVLRRPDPLSVICR